MLSPGATLYIKSGTYAESLINAGWEGHRRIPGGTSWSAPVTVAAYPGHVVTLRPASGDWVLYFGTPQSQYIIIDGLIIDAADGWDAIKITGGAHHIRIMNGEVKNAPWQGILVGGRFNEFINLKIHHNGSLADYNVNGNHRHGIYIGTSDNLVEGCELYDNLHTGIHVFMEGGLGADRNVIRNNRAYRHEFVSIIITSGVGNVVYNNVVYDSNAGIQADHGARDTEIYHNTAYRNGSYGGIHNGVHSTNARIQNNILYQNSGGGLVDYGAGTTRSNNLEGQDPRFVNAGAFDFHLQSTSPAISAGTRIDSVTTDFDGVQRPQVPAIGAFEGR